MGIGDQLSKGNLESFSEWVSFDPAGKILNEAVKKGLLGPLTILIDKAPEAIDVLMLGIDEANAALLMVEDAITAYSDPALLLAKTTIQTVLAIMNKAVAMFMSIKAGGEIKVTAFVAEKNRWGIPMARGFDPRLEEVLTEWQNKPSGDRVWGFVFFPLYLPAFSTDALMDAIDDASNMVTNDIAKISKMLKKHSARLKETYTELEGALTEEDRSRLRNEQKRLAAERKDAIAKMAEVLVDSVKTGTYASTTIDTVRENDADVGESVLLSYKNRSAIKVGADGGVVDNVSVNALKKQAEYVASSNTFDVTLVLPDNTKVTITAITLVGVGKEDSSKTKKIVLYRNMQHDIMAILPPVDLAVATTENLTFDERGYYLSRITTQLGAASMEVDAELADEYIEEIMHMLAITTFSQTKAWLTLLEMGSNPSDVNASYYTRKLSFEYSDIQEKIAIGGLLPSGYTPSKFSIQLSDTDKEELELEDYDYSVAIHVVPSEEYALPSDIILKGDEISEDDIVTLVTDYMENYASKYRIEYTPVSNYYAIPVAGYNKKADEESNMWTDDHSAKRWRGGSLASVTMEELLGKNKKVVKTIYEIVDDINAVGEFAIDIIDDAMDITKDVVSITEMVRALINRILKDYLLDLLKRMKDALDMPGMGMVAGVINGDPTEAKTLINKVFAENNMTRYVYGGVLLLGGSDMLKTMLNMLSAIDEIGTLAQQVKKEADNIGDQWSDAKKRLEARAENMERSAKEALSKIKDSKGTTITRRGVAMLEMSNGQSPPETEIEYKDLMLALDTIIEKGNKNKIYVRRINTNTIL